MADTNNPITTLGIGHGRFQRRPVGIRLSDRLLHSLAIGRTGTGKTTLLHNFVRQDAAANIGVMLVDPHGDLANALMVELGDRAIIWNVADPTCPYGYNPLTKTSAAMRPLVASGLIETLKKQWVDAWGARMEHLLRYAILALLDTTQPDMRQIIPLYLDKEFRGQVLPQIQNVQVRAFWENEFPAMNYKTAADGVAPIANKLGAFLAHPVVCQALCAPKKPLRFRSIMDQEQILIVNLAKGKVGTDLANVIGGLVVSAAMNAGFSRQEVPEAERRPFVIYVDEFHNFISTSFADALAESRKYGLAMMLSTQQLGTVPPEMVAATLGNVGSLFCFRVGALDAPLLARQLGDVRPRDLLNLPNYRAMARVMNDGTQSAPFTLETLKI